MQLIYKYYSIKVWPKCFCWYLVYSNGPNYANFSIFSIFGVIFGQNWRFWPPWVAHLYIGLPPTFMQLILKIKHLSFTHINLCGYYMLSHCPNSGDCCIISLYAFYGVIFSQNLGFWPLGCPLIVSPNIVGWGGLEESVMV